MNPPFGKWRARLWPIHAFELKKVLPLFLIKFFISFNYGILASLKDTLVVTTKNSGAEVIPVLKGWVVLPIAILASIIYAKLSNHFKRSTLFYGIIIFFLAFFALYGFVLYPNRELICPHQSADWLIQRFGEKYQYWVAVYRHWPQTLFFVFSELWGSIVIFLLFWGFMNQISPIHEAKRFYTLFSAGGNLAAFATGPLVWFYAKKFIEKSYLLTLQWLIAYILFFGFLILTLHWWVVKHAINKQQNAQNISNTRTRLSLIEGIKHVFSSKHLRYISLMVIGYGLVMNLVEVTWKANLKLYYPSPADYQSFWGTITSCVGIISFFISVFVGGNVIRFFGWRFSAMIPPIIVGTTGTLFLGLVFLHNHYPIYSFGAASLFFIVIFGAFQNILSKAVKYSFFDPTKEMAFIPLDNEGKTKGKAAIDVVGSRLGKSGSAWIQIFLIEFATLSGSVLSITQYILPIVLLMTIRWMFAVRSLHKDYLSHAERVSEEISAEKKPTLVKNELPES